MKQREEIITMIADNGVSQVVHFCEVGLKGSSTRKQWIKAIENNGYNKHGKGWDFDYNDFHKKN